MTGQVPDVPQPIEQNRDVQYRPVSFRLSFDDTHDIISLAILDETSPASEIRGAVSDYIKRRLSDPALEILIERRAESWHNEDLSNKYLSDPNENISLIEDIAAASDTEANDEDFQLGQAAQEAAERHREHIADLLGITQPDAE